MMKFEFRERTFPDQPHELHGTRYMAPIELAHAEFDLEAEARRHLLRGAGIELMASMTPGWTYEISHHWDWIAPKGEFMRGGKVLRLIVRVKPTAKV
jgi:hypothetical protein